MIGWMDQVGRGKRDGHISSAEKMVKKKIPYLEDWRTQYHSPKVMPKHA